MASIVIELRNDKVNEIGEAPIHFRVIKNRKSSRISTGLKVPIKYWDEKNKKIKKGFQNSARFNAFIYQKLSELQDQIVDEESRKKSLTTRQLKDKLVGKAPTDFFSFAETVLNDYHDAGKIGTYLGRCSYVNTLKTYAKFQSLTFQDITVEYLTKYEKYLQNSLHLKVNTINAHFRFIRKLFNDALRLDLIEYEHNPFRKMILKTEKTSRTFLSEDELLLIENFETKKGTRVDLHKKMFVFAAYSGGLRISDVLKLKWDNFNGTHITIDIHKTKTPLSIKLPNKAIKIINEFKTKKTKSSDFIFPMLNNDLDLNSPTETHHAISCASAYVNKNLKIIAKTIGIEKPLSFHISRHTWATRALRKGISIDKVSKLMGHAQLRETQIYAKIVNEELDKAMDVFND